LQQINAATVQHRNRYT